MDADSVAFLRNKGDEGLEVVNVPLAEIHAAEAERLPRTRYFEQFMPEGLMKGLLPVLDYAMAQGFSRFCIPTAEFNYGTIQEAAHYLAETFSINGTGAPGALEIQSFPQEDGRTLIFLLVTLGGLEENEEGSWTVQVFEYRSGGFTRREDRITLEKLGEDWCVVAKVEPVS